MSSKRQSLAEFRTKGEGSFTSGAFTFQAYQARRLALLLAGGNEVTKTISGRRIRRESWTHNGGLESFRKVE
jgi:hypothetical protein